MNVLNYEKLFRDLNTFNNLSQVVRIEFLISTLFSFVVFHHVLLLKINFEDLSLSLAIQLTIWHGKIFGIRKYTGHAMTSASSFFFLLFFYCCSSDVSIEYACCLTKIFSFYWLLHTQRLLHRVLFCSKMTMK